MSDIAALVARLDRAFPERERGLGKEDLRALRRAITGLDDAAVKRLLPAILVDILNEPRSGCSEEDDMVIYFLDGRKLCEADPDERGFQCTLAERTFRSFTNEQASVISAWLSAVADYEFIALCEGDYRSAVEYWAERGVRCRA